ncbi:TPA: phage baseplate assembly protein V [Stenotrophomonas maltophilia]|uniref:phage baseplate assembly protein V n=1 Tax=Stenotrophomonas TaxID=40323 RepID=UPI00066BDB73|nr:MULTISPECIES: phage baseplate assembly protein V [Stenotrophomonas]ELF4107576.1 phage baseplate assembly protein V [Stenotrophomonas maltophilia]MBO1745249.1 phage baseplate assembly protein V [Stenotrophomonas maltophilia]MCU1172990.1 phage baseplate assembly protein V [Stenotrophomonas maltophilia]MDH2178169.1 phage baseplate assembly protein V [Stenotrophomonas sp. GD03654]WAP02836.1 phage baseplate assembly protein V [Stenotrophomonas sp. SBJS02]
MSAEHARLIGNLLMIGVVRELDEANGRVRVDADGMLTDWIPWLERRAGPGMRSWCTPEPGEQVVLACPYGDPGQALVLGSLYQDRFPPPADSRLRQRTEFADGSTVEYDQETTTLSVNVGNGKVIVTCASAQVIASESVLLDTPSLKATGDLQVTGAISAGKDITTPGEIKAGAIGLKAHKHTAQGPTAPTTPAQA